MESGVTLIVVDAVELPFWPQSIATRHADTELDSDRARIKEPVSQAASLGVEVEHLRVRSPRPAEAVIQIATERRAGLLVFGRTRAASSRASSRASFGASVSAPRACSGLRAKGPRPTSARRAARTAAPIQPVREVGGRQRPADAVALRDVAAERAQRRQAPRPRRPRRRRVRPRLCAELDVERTIIASLARRSTMLHHERLVDLERRSPAGACRYAERRVAVPKSSIASLHAHRAQAARAPPWPASGRP